MQKKLLIGLLAVSSYVSASVSNGFYAGLEAGIANQVVSYNSSEFNFASNGVAFSSSGLSAIGRLNLGYTSSKYNSFELGTNYNFAATLLYPNAGSSISTSAWNTDASYLLSFPLAIDRFAVFGRGGFAYDWINSNNLCSCSGLSGITGNGLADILGAGVKYNISPNLVWRTEWISNGLLFPLEITGSTGQNIGSWSVQQFQTGFNYYY